MTKIVDREVPNRSNYKIHDEYAILLNQTDIENNNNKFYIIQLLTDEKKYYLWTRWGRVGESGKNDFDELCTEDSGISAFKKKFKDKTSNHWDKKDSFVSKSGKYTIVETDEKEGADGGEASPMGKLSQVQIEKGQEILKKIGESLEKNEDSIKKIDEEEKKPTKKKAVKKTDNNEDEDENEKKSSKKKIIKKADEESSIDRSKELIQLSSQFFTLIPTVSGRKRPDPIVTIDMLQEKEELLKFYLRMGFDVVEKDETGLTPIAGILDLLLPTTLLEAVNKCCDAGSVNSSVSKGDKLAKQKAGNPTKEMNKELYGAIMLYTSNAIYKDLNKVLRDENRSGVKKYFKYLRMLFEAMDRLPKNKVTLWRGLSVDLSKQYKIGETVTWWGVSSCTADINVATNFMAGCGGDCSLLTIDTVSATDISQITFYSNEKESLLAPGTQLKVLSMEKKGKTTHIHLQEVGRQIC